MAAGMSDAASGSLVEIDMARKRDEAPSSQHEVLDLLSDDDGALMLCCTNGDQHPRTVLGAAAASYDGRHFWHSVERQRVTPGSTVYVDGNRTVHIDCTRCPLHVEWREGRADAIVNDLLTAGFTELDISRIPGS
jgi:hypothetical protein